MSKKYVIVVNVNVSVVNVLDHCEAFPHGWTNVISFHFLLQSSELYWPFGLVFIGPRSDHSLPMSVTD